MAEKTYTALDIADAQFIGFSTGKRESGIIHLIEGMGLTKKEWLEWKAKYTTTYLTEREIEEIDTHFKIPLSPKRLFADKERVLVSFNNMSMQVLSAVECAGGWKYKLAFLKMDGSPNKAKEVRYYMEREIQKEPAGYQEKKVWLKKNGYQLIDQKQRIYKKGEKHFSYL